MEISNSQIVINFNPSGQSLTVSYLEPNNSKSKNAQIFKIIDIPISDLITNGKDKAEKLIGNTVLRTLQNIRKTGIGLEQYYKASDTDDDIEQLFSIIERKAKEGDAKAQYALAGLYQHKSVRTKNVKLLDVAEDWYKKSAENGYEEAQRFLKESWQELKKLDRKRIEQNKDQN